jgi:tetratricopeptide (TPR) repeat protein
MLAPSLDSPLTRSFSSPARGLERDGISSPVAVEEDFDGLSKGALYKRKDFLDVEEDAKLHPERTYYYRKVVDLDKAIEQCNRKLAESPRNVKALTTRAGCFMKKKLFAKAADDFSAVLAVTPEDVSVLYSRGAAYDKLGQTTDAIVSVIGQEPSQASAGSERTVSLTGAVGGLLISLLVHGRIIAGAGG